jgi:hypothetical protein
VDGGAAPVVLAALLAAVMVPWGPDGEKLLLLVFLARLSLVFLGLAPALLAGLGVWFGKRRAGAVPVRAFLCPTVARGPTEAEASSRSAGMSVSTTGRPGMSLPVVHPIVLLCGFMPPG